MTYYYPTGTFGRRYRMTTPVYYSSPMYITSGYSTPTQTYNTVPQQEVFYQPVQQRRGLLGIFQPRWRQQAVPVYTTPGYTTSGYANMGYVTPGYTTHGPTRGLHAHHLLLQHAVRNRSGEHGRRHGLGGYGAGRYDSCL